MGIFDSQYGQDYFFAENEFVGRITKKVWLHVIDLLCIYSKNVTKQEY